MAKHHSLNNLRVRINRYLLRDQHHRVGLSLKELQKLKFLEKGKNINGPVLAENTVILFKDLIRSCILINSEQILQYSVISLGKTIQLLQSAGEKQLPKVLQLETFEQGSASVQTFANHANQWLKNDKFNSSSVTANFQFYSTPNQLGQIVADMLQTYPQFEQLLESKEITTVLRYQVGYQFYQDRVKRFINERPHNPHHLVLSFRGKYNFGVVSYHKISMNIVALYDCKFSMAEVDINRVENWLAGASKIGLSEGSQSKLMPLLRLLE